VGGGLSVGAVAGLWAVVCKVPCNGVGKSGESGFGGDNGPIGVQQSNKPYEGWGGPWGLVMCSRVINNMKDGVARGVW